MTSEKHQTTVLFQDDSRDKVDFKDFKRENPPAYRLVPQGRDDQDPKYS